MSNYPDDRGYTKEHEWARIDGDIAIIGITPFAVEQLGDITMVELPTVGDTVTKNDVFGTVESVKAVSDLFAPMSGEVVKVNDDLVDAPELLNEDCMSKAWIVQIKLSDKSELDALLSNADYAALATD